jgi:phosphoesterase RecJ-like protein
MSESSSLSSSADPRAAVVDWPRFVRLVRSKQRILLTTHIRPDCDALGSVLAMEAVLRRLGKEVEIVTAFDLPPNYRFIDPDGRIKRLGSGVSDAWVESIDLLLVLDTSAWAQLGEMGDVIRSTQADKGVLDHHVSGDDLGAELFKDTSAEATGRIVVDAADQLGVELTGDVAKPLFAALATDTGWFRFASATGKTYHLAARLVDAGAVPHELYQGLYENETLSRLQLVGRTMARTRTELDGRLIYTWIERKDFDAFGALPSDSEDVINTTLSVGGTEFAVILVEQQDGGFKISFRSRAGVDCSRVAETFGGGGHVKAAGAFLNEPLESARAKVLDVVRAAMR